MKKNVAGQSIGAEMISATDGSAFTGTVTVYVTGDNGTQAIGTVGSGICTHKGNGYHSYAPAQAETNYDHIAFAFIGTGAIPATVQLHTGFPATGDTFTRIGAAGAGLTALGDARLANLDAAASTLATAASQALIKAKTDQLTFTALNKVDSTIQAAGDLAQGAADKVWASAARTLTAFGFSVTVGTNTDKTGYTLSAAGVQAVWDALTSALTTVGSIGKLLVTNIDALISSRSTYAGGDTSGTTTLLSRITGLLPLASDYTSARATKLDNLDATVSSRSTFAGGAVASVTAGVTVTTNNDKTGYALSAAGVQAVWDALTSALTTVGSIGKRLADNVDALISSRSTYAGGDTSGTTTLLSRVGTPAGASVSADLAAVKVDTASAVTKATDLQTRLPAALVGGRIDSAVGAMAAGVQTTASFAVGAIDPTVLSSGAEQAIADKVMATAVDGTITHKQMMQILGAALAGKASGAGTTSITFRDVNDTRNCIIATVDAIGDRSAITLSVI